MLVNIKIGGNKNMRSYEIAAVKMAVKRSIKGNDIQKGYNSINKWFEHWKNQGIYVDIDSVTKCFKKWIKRQTA